MIIILWLDRDFYNSNKKKKKFKATLLQSQALLTVHYLFYILNLLRLLDKMTNRC